MRASRTACSSTCSAKALTAPGRNGIALVMRRLPRCASTVQRLSENRRVTVSGCGERPLPRRLVRFVARLAAAPADRLAGVASFAVVAAFWDEAGLLGGAFVALGGCGALAWVAFAVARADGRAGREVAAAVRFCAAGAGAGAVLAAPPLVDRLSSAGANGTSSRPSRTTT